MHRRGDPLAEPETGGGKGGEARRLDAGRGVIGHQHAVEARDQTAQHPRDLVPQPADLDEDLLLDAHGRPSGAFLVPRPRPARGGYQPSHGTLHLAMKTAKLPSSYQSVG